MCDRFASFKAGRHYCIYGHALIGCFWGPRQPLSVTAGQQALPMLAKKMSAISTKHSLAFRKLSWSILVKVRPPHPPIYTTKCLPGFRRFTGHSNKVCSRQKLSFVRQWFKNQLPVFLCVSACIMFAPPMLPNQKQWKLPMLAPPHGSRRFDQREWVELVDVTI